MLDSVRIKVHDDLKDKGEGSLLWRSEWKSVKRPGKRWEGELWYNERFPIVLPTLRDLCVTELAQEVLSVNLEEELKQSYLDYAMSVIVGRALPDVRDGLKPVHRRVLFAMSELKNDWDKPYKKSARVVGDVVGKYHPHGDSAVYDTIVRMAQTFSMRYVLVDGQGNFGSVDGDAAAAMRYTEVRLSQFAHRLLHDMEKETVDFSPNYDGTEKVPVVLPARVPHLLINGASGIAVGMATNIPPHHLGEVIDGCLALLEAPDITIEELMRSIPGPDFPTKGIINGHAGILEAYRTGKGKMYVRARTEIEEIGGKQAIIVTEIPYQVNKARLIEKIAELVKEKKIEGIAHLRDESNKEGMRIVIELKRQETPEVILNNLYAHTAMESVFGINMVALVDGQPRTLNLKQILECFLRHRRQVVNRRTTYELGRARARAHLLEGLGVALANVDEMVQLVKQAPSPLLAKKALMERLWAPGIVASMRTQMGIVETDKTEEASGLEEGRYRLSEHQAQAILELKLQRLTGLEQEKIWKEYEALLSQIRSLRAILEDPKRLLQVIREELGEMRETFLDERQTEIVSTKQELLAEDLIHEETRVVTLSYQGYVKTQALEGYIAQRRGGRGKVATSVREEDFVDQMVVANTHDTILCFSSLGKVYWLKVYRLPVGSRNALGKPIVNLIPSLEARERISAILPLKQGQEEATDVVMATKRGVIKKVALSEFSRPRSSGILAIGLEDEDELIGVDTLQAGCDILLFTDSGKAIRFAEKAVRRMGRAARGVRGIQLGESTIISLMVVREPEAMVLTATENGYGKRTLLKDFPRTGRGGQGVIAIQTTERNGKAIGAVLVRDNDEMMLITDRGMLVRTRVEEVSIVGRNTQGVTLMHLQEGEKLVKVAPIREADHAPEEDDPV